MSLGLRGKSALALGVSIVVVLALALVAGWRALHSVEENLGAAYTRNFTRYNEQRILAPIMRELALSERLADSEVTRRWLLDENDAQKKSLFVAEAARYQRAFGDRSYFVISAITRHYYFNDSKSARSDKPRYSLNPADPDDAWFFTSMKTTGAYNINVNVDNNLQVTKVWFNVVVRDGARKLGLAGTGLDLSTVLDRFVKSAEPGVTPMVFNSDGAIQAHPDRGLINFDSISGAKREQSTIFRLLGAEDAARVRRTMERVREGREELHLLPIDLAGRRQVLALVYVPELKWFVATAVDVKAARVLDNRLWVPMLLGFVALFGVLILAVVFFVNRILLQPVLRLTHSVRQVAAGQYNVKLPPDGNDELGELTRAFRAMTDQVRTHTDELENKIQERTKELRAINEQMTVANKNIGDSIRYARLIQSAILPDREISQALRREYFVWWRPRDVVGGDLYVFRSDDNGFLIGVVDCAGHGVPGALMTMIAHGIVNVVLDAVGMRDPAAVLRAVDMRLRSTLQSSEDATLLATHMEAGLAYVDLAAKTVLFAGAKTSLYWSDGQQVGELKGIRGALGGKRQIVFENQHTDLQGRSFYLTTDGVLDQSGGERGYSFGNQRFTEMLRRNAREPFEAQQKAFERELMAYQNGRPQRDDITVLGFAVEHNSGNTEQRHGAHEPLSAERNL